MTILGKLTTGRRKVGTAKYADTMWVFGGYARAEIIDRIEKINLNAGGKFEEVSLPS